MTDPRSIRVDGDLLGIAFVVLFVFLYETRRPPRHAGFFTAVLVDALALAVKRLHDRGKSPGWLLVALVPVLGPLWLLSPWPAARHARENHYGPDPLQTVATT